MINTRLSKYLQNSESTCYHGSYSHLSEQHDLSINSIAKSNFIYNHQVPLALKIISTHIPIALVTKESTKYVLIPSHLRSLPLLGWNPRLISPNYTKLAPPCALLTKLSYSIIF